MVTLKSAREIEAMRRSGKITSKVLTDLMKAVRPGIATADLDRMAERGIREAGNLFAIPSYLFIFSFGGMIAFGLVRLALGHDISAQVPHEAVEAGTDALTGLLLLRAFASGAAALTGIEAIADGVPSFKAPEARNAATTLTWMATILACTAPANPSGT